jgi:hypothetical protein
MTLSVTSVDPRLWALLTRLGEADILLPAALLAAAALFFQAHSRRLATRWTSLIFGAALLTTASKLAFIGWGVGWAAMDFTGISGHAMFAAAIYPVLLTNILPGDARGKHRLALALGCALALLIGLTRLVLGVHSLSEVVSGLLLGGAVSALTLSAAGPVAALRRPMIPGLLVLWMALTPFQLPASQTHSLVTRLALAMSGHEAPFTRADLLSRQRRDASGVLRVQAPCNGSLFALGRADRMRLADELAGRHLRAWLVLATQEA